MNRYYSRPPRGNARKAWDAFESRYGKNLSNIYFSREKKVWIGYYVRQLSGCGYWPRIPKVKIDADS